MQCYTDLTPPTAVTHSVSLPFLSAAANNLVVAKTSLLQIFSLKSVISDANDGNRRQDVGAIRRAVQGGDLDSSAHNRKSHRGERIHTTKLVLIAQYELSGVVTALGRVKPMHSKSGGEALLVALQDAKLSLVEWDPERYSISTVSIHCYEREDLQGPPWSPEVGQCVNILTVDPSSRCAALKFGSRNIAILPFHQAGDDLVMDDYDPEVDTELTKPLTSPSKLTNGDTLQPQTPYNTSFVLSLMILDPNLTHPVCLAFLHEYREPTFGVLSSRSAVSSALLHERQDTLSYTVYTLDLEQRASTTLLSVAGLPYDLHMILPLPLPVGGALLIGFNELIHVDQAGKTNGVAVNEFARQCSSFSLPYTSELNLRLEGCVIEPFGTSNGELLLILNTGELAILGFKQDGRTVSGLSLRRVAPRNGGSVLCATASCSASIGRGRMFIGSEDGDSIVLGWSRRSTKTKKQRYGLRMEVDGEASVSDLEEDELEDEDDFYASSKPEGATHLEVPLPEINSEVDDYAFRIHDRLRNLAPLGDVIFKEATDPKASAGIPLPSLLNREMLVSAGRGRAGALCKVGRKIDPVVDNNLDLSGIYGVWSVHAQKSAAEGMAPELADEKLDRYDNILIVSGVGDMGDEQSAVYELASGNPQESPQNDFDTTGGTVEVGVFGGGTRIIQVLKSEIRTYDGDLGLAQIFALSEDTTESDAKVVSASFAEPYVLLIRDDSSMMLVREEESGDLEEVDRGDFLKNAEWLSGSLFGDLNDIFHLEADDESQEEGGNVLMFLLSAEGALKIYHLSNLNKAIYTADGLSFLPPFLASDFTVRRSAAREALIEILIAELGDTAAKAPYMILRSANGDITMYQPYQCPIKGEADTALRFLKVPNPHMTQLTSNELLYGITEDRKPPLRSLQDINGYSTVYVHGAAPTLIIKHASSLPQVVSLRLRGIRSLSSFHSPACHRGFLYSDTEGNVTAARLPHDNNYSTGWVTQQVFSGEHIESFDYHERTDRYVLGTSQKVDFKLPEDELHYEWAAETTSCLPQLDHGSVKVLDPSTWSITDTYDLDPAEVVMSIKTMNLETSENASARRSLVAVGTSFLLGEDLPARGRIYVFDIIEVVPEPDHPETGLKLKLIAKEEIKGGVTTLSEIGTEGFLLAAQGQKCMVRGLKEDGTLLPVSFMDMQCYVSVAKELGGTGMCLMGDVVKGVWFAGYTEDPYQLRLFSKSTQHIEVITADFLPYADQLYIVVFDASSNLHILQFDPDHPKSLIGQRLIHHTTFHTASYPSTATLLPRRPTPYELIASPPSSPTLPSPSLQAPPLATPATNASHHILTTSRTGAISLLTPLSPSTYRQLSALQSYLTSTLPHQLGLNPRAHRHVESSGSASVGAGGGLGGGRGGGWGQAGRGVLDGNLLRRWSELGSWKKAEAVGRCGVEGGEWEVRGLVDGVTGGGLGGL